MSKPLVFSDKLNAALSDLRTNIQKLVGEACDELEADMPAFKQGYSPVTKDSPKPGAQGFGHFLRVKGNISILDNAPNVLNHLETIEGLRDNVSGNKPIVTIMNHRHHFTCREINNLLSTFLEEHGEELSEVYRTQIDPDINGAIESDKLAAATNALGQVELSSYVRTGDEIESARKARLGKGPGIIGRGLRIISTAISRDPGNNDSERQI